jgi:hypothetical protein
MRNQQVFLILFLIIQWSFIGCEVVESNEEQAEVILTHDQILIKDKTGKSWDVTHAVNHYEFEPEKFRSGLGPFAILPILNPNMLSRGQFGFPNNDESFLILGTILNGHTRAYPLSALSRHEVVDERFDSTYVAVAY